MCILSIQWKDKNNFILTHNRDEDGRKNYSLDFDEHEFFEEKVNCPLDGMSGGTWIFYSKKYVACVLNGGFDFHQPGRGSYRMSRGKLILELLKSHNLESYISSVNTTNIEPFTFVLIDTETSERVRFVWDGREKYSDKIEENVFVWSSSTLYTEEQKQDNRRILQNSIDSESKPTEIISLHEEIRLRKHPFAKYVRTLSIGQIIMDKGQIDSSFCHFNS